VVNQPALAREVVTGPSQRRRVFPPGPRWLTTLRWNSDKTNQAARISPVQQVKQTAFEVCSERCNTTSAADGVAYEPPEGLGPLCWIYNTHHSRHA